MKRWRLAGFVTIVAAMWVSTALRAQESYTRIEDVIYRRKDGVALTMDVFKPAKPSGVGVLYMVSGGWFSSHEAINPGSYKGFLDRGETVFAIVHGSQPRYQIPDIVQDIDRAARFVRYHAKEYGVDPNRLGISGGSAGGHLSLWQGAHGHDGDSNAKDPVDRVSSKVQAVACFFPPTDFLNWGTTGTNALTVENLKPFYVAFGAKSREPAELEAVSRAESPIYDVTKDMPPTLIIHGSADALVPIQQAEIFMKKLDEVGVEHKLVVREGKGHGWPEIATQDIPVVAEWIDQHCR